MHCHHSQACLALVCIWQDMYSMWQITNAAEPTHFSDWKAEIRVWIKIAKSLADTVKETGSTFRGLGIISTVNYWATNETSEKYYILNNQSSQEQQYMLMCLWCSTCS